MKSQFNKLSILITIIIILNSCGTKEEQGATQKHEIVFNEFNVDQPRGHFAFVQNEVIDSYAHAQGASAGLLSRSSGILENPEFKLQVQQVG